ncbi:AraC family transcriptional regulator [Novispirillum itersonii]|uniref:AraC family transcriptional regulator n=1 Tax=Novispirillum itersonii TaxID=189 RepID=UPI000379DE75|nr:AraC family transcriptional regulator [Novispirillum itersonii]
MSDRAEYRRNARMPGLVLGHARFETTHFDRHYHLDYHIGLVTDGAQRQSFAHTSALLGPGAISLMPPGEMHDGLRAGDQPFTLLTYRIPAPLMQSVLEDFSDSGLRPASAEMPALAPAAVEAPDLAPRLISLHHTLFTTPDAPPLATQTGWLMQLATLLTRSRALSAPHQSPGTLSPRDLRQVQAYCHAHLAEKISLDDLAGLCGLRRFTFLRQFQRSLGMTPYAWLLRLRLEQACALLTERRLSVATVAQETGFYDQSHFNRAFRRAYGVAPSAY